VRILFQLAFPGYLRMYGSTVRLLGERGHTVLLSYDDPDKRRDPAVSAIEAVPGVEVVPPLPAASRAYEARVEQLRAAADYLRYLDPRFSAAPYLRQRLAKYLEGPSRALTRLPVGWWGARPALRLALALERTVPSDRGLERALAACSPQIVVVTPLLGRSRRNRRQTDTVKSARKLGIPVAAGIASWDHLTTKGVIKATPDVTFVWNDIQRRDAVELHFQPRVRVAVTGAQLFDDWFDRPPSSDADAFRTATTLRPGPYVLYVGSSPNIVPPEVEVAFVRRWLAATGVQALVRPHPYSVEAWSEVELEGGAVAPRRPPELPMSPADEALYFDSVHHAAAVVGINTSALVESLIQRKPVLTIAADEYRQSQEGTVHFRELRAAAGPALQTAASLEEHVQQLRTALDDPAGAAAGAEEFLRVFVRPLGLDRPATPILADAIEALGRR
jgi:hypothetical protein